MLNTNLSFSTGIRPAVVVLAIGVAVTAAGAIRATLMPPAKRLSAA